VASKLVSLKSKSNKFYHNQIEDYFKLIN